MQATDAQGRTISFDSPNGAMPSENELNQMFAVKYGGQQTPSISSQGIGYVAQHPVKTLIDPLAKTITGKSLQDRALDATVQNIPTPTQAPFDANVNAARNPINQFNQIGKNSAAGAVGSALDMATTPVNYAIPASKVAGAGVDAVAGGVTGLGKFFNFDQRALSLGAKVRQVAAAAKLSTVDKFGASVDAQATANPTKTVSLENVVNDIKSSLANPESGITDEAKTVFRKTPLLNGMLKEPGSAGYIDPANVSLKDTQEIINYINTKIPKSIKASSLDVLDAQNDIRAAQLDAFPEMAQTRADYGKFAEDYKLIKSVLNPKSTPNAIMTNFNNNIAVKDAANRVLSPVVGDMAKLRSQAGIVGWLKKLGIGAIGAGAVYEVGKRVMGK